MACLGLIFGKNGYNIVIIVTIIIYHHQGYKCILLSHRSYTHFLSCSIKWTE